MKRTFALAICVLMLLCFFGCSRSSEVDKNNAALSEAVKAINTDEIVLNDLTTFDWDVMYTFDHFLPKENIEKIIGFSSYYIKATYNEAQTQMIFLKDNKLVCSIWGYSNNIGFFVSFGRYDGDYLAIEQIENAVFTVDYSGDEIVLTYKQG